MSKTEEALPPLERAIDDYLDGYVLEGDDSYHLPTEHEKLIVKDAILGLLEEPEFSAALAQRQHVPADESAWWALAMGAAASLEDAAICMRDPDAEKAARGAAAHVRRQCTALTAAPPAQQGDEFERGRQLGMQQERALWELAASTQEIESAQQTCRKCGGQMRPGKAIAQTFDCSDEGTMSPGGPGKLVDCLKCEACGASTT